MRRGLSVSLATCLALSGCALTGCKARLAPELTKPLAEWRSTGVNIRRIQTVGGPLLQIPVSFDVTCSDPGPSNPLTDCGFTLDEASGRLQHGDTSPLTWLHVSMSFEVGRYEYERGIARPYPRQWPGSGLPLNEAPVRQSLTGVSGGQPFTLGCWDERTVSGPPAYACVLVIRNRSIGDTVVDFYAPRPPAGADPARPDPSAPPFDLARLDRIVAIMGQIEASFTAP